MADWSSETSEDVRVVSAFPRVKRSPSSSLLIVRTLPDSSSSDNVRRIIEKLQELAVFGQV